MSQISLKSISGITSITTPAGVDNQLTVHTNDTTERIKVTTSGLNVTGVVTATSFQGDGSALTGIAADKIFEGNTEAEVVDTGSNGHFKVTTEGGERLRITSDGKIGVNNNNPSYTLDVNGDNGGGFTATTNSTAGQLSVVGKNSAGNVSAISRIKSHPSGSGNTSYMTFETRNSSSVMVERLRIASDGKIGINTTPTHSFELFSGADHENVMMIKGTNSAGNYAGVGVYQGNAVFTGGGIGSNSTGLVFRSAASGSETERLRITSDGKIGVGDFSSLTARAQVHIHQPDSNGSFLRFTNSTSGTGATDGAEIGLDADEGLSIYNLENDYIRFGTNNTERVRITNGGALTMSSGTVELQSHMIRVGNRTTAQINAGVSTSTGALLLDTTENNIKYYANAKWRTIKQQANDGSTQSLAARSAKALLDDGITANGVYYLDMHGAYSAGNAKLHYCLMDTSYDGGGWTMLYSMNHGNNFASGSNYSFSVNVGSPTTVNDFTAGNWGYDRRNTFTPAANDQFLIRRSDNNDWKRFVVSVWSPTYNNVSNGWETLNKTDGSNTGHPYWALGQMYDSSGNSVSNHIHFNGCAKGGNCNSGGGDGSGFGEYSQWLNGEGHSSYGGAYNSQSAGGSPLYWGQGNSLSQGGSLYIQMFYRKAGTQ